MAWQRPEHKVQPSRARARATRFPARACPRVTFPGCRPRAFLRLWWVISKFVPSLPASALTSRSSACEMCRLLSPGWRRRWRIRRDRPGGPARRTARLLPGRQVGVEIGQRLVGAGLELGDFVRTATGGGDGRPSPTASFRAPPRPGRFAAAKRSQASVIAPRNGPALRVFRPSLGLR
jgi:hypothetical protein